jgi:hypothetical protein
MLHKDHSIISPETFQLTQQLQSLPELADFYLVGGTSLALQLGHRNSIDIDLFSQSSFDSSGLISTLNQSFHLQVDAESVNTLLTHINWIKVDFITHAYPLVKAPITEEGITYLSKEDIAAMKLNAIAGSGQRLKDFIDVYFLLESLSVNDMLECYAIKYPNSNPLIALKAISYFNDIDPEIDPPQMKQPVALDTIKNRITEAVLHPYKTF